MLKPNRLWIIATFLLIAKEKKKEERGDMNRMGMVNSTDFGNQDSLNLKLNKKILLVEFYS